MKKFLKWLGVVLAVLIVLLIAAISLTIGWRPFIGPRSRPLTNRKFQPTPERLARGIYLANGVMGCIFCHSEHDFQAPGEPPVAAMLGAGQVFPEKNLPGLVVAPNLTPDAETGAGTWTDDQFARAIREGIGHDGRTLFPLMPYEEFRAMSDEDLASIVVYLRSLPPVRHPLGKTDIIFPVKYLIRNAPEPLLSAVPPPDLTTPVKRGEYLVRMASCEGCHTPQQRGQRNTRMAYSGGFTFHVGPLPSVASANITPDPSGIPYYDENLFIEVIRTGRVRARQLSSVMPFVGYKNMTDEDLKAIFAYLRTLPPVHHRVDNSLPPTFCKLCQETHGAGDQN